MAHCSKSLYRLTVLDDPAWDRRAVREQIDILALCDRLIRSYEEAAEKRRVVGGTSVEEDQFTRGARVLRSMKAGVEAEMAIIDRGGGDQAMIEEGGQSQGSGVGQICSMMTGPLSTPLFQTYQESEGWFSDVLTMNWQP